MRTEYCGQLNLSHVGQEVTLCGWVNRRRDLGGLIFIDMRDREGIVQVFFDPDEKVAFDKAYDLRNEFCIQIVGTVRARPDSQINKDMATGEVEVFAHALEIINRSEPLPLDSNQVNSEEARLKYRYLDLRRPEMAERLKTRAKITSFVRRFMDSHGFLDIETPMLTKATPEGARDYLVPSRVHKGKFYALPQSPQLFKQLLMMSGFDRYYQIVKCFRDEDLRADRQPEFTQIDVETSFMTADQVREVMEKLARELWLDVKGVDLGDFPVMTFAEAMRRFGSDKPDLRNPLELVDVADLVKDVEFKVFSGPANDAKGRVAAIRVPGGAQLTRKQIDEYGAFVNIYGAKGLAWLKVNDRAAGMEGVQSPIAKFLSAEVLEAVLARTNAQTGDILFFGADSFKIVTDAMGALRLKLGRDLGLTQLDSWAPLQQQLAQVQKERDIVRQQAERQEKSLKTALAQQKAEAAKAAGELQQQLATLQGKNKTQTEQAKALEQRLAALTTENAQTVQLRNKAAQQADKTATELAAAQQAQQALREELDGLRSRAKWLPESQTLKKKPEQQSYAAGVALGRDIQTMLAERKNWGITPDKTVLLAGVIDTFSGHYQLSDAQLTSALAESEKAVNDARNQAAKTQTSKGEAFVAEFKKKKGTQKSPAGFWYRIDYAGDEAIKENARVDIVVKESLTDGRVIQDMDRSGKVMSQPLSAYPPLFREAIGHLKNHGSLTMVVPPALAYGETGYAPQIPPNATMVYELRIVDVSNG